MITNSAAYYIYIIYALGVLAFFLIGHRKWQGWALMAFVHTVFGITGYLNGVQWLVLGSATYLIVDVTLAVLWFSRGKYERRAAQRFMAMMRDQFAEGKKEAIYELMRLERDIQELAGGNPYPFGGRRRNDSALQELLDKAKAAEQERQQD